MLRLVLVVSMLAACRSRGADVIVDTDPGTVDTDDPDNGPLGWIGSPCATASDCPYEGSTCIRDVAGYPDGMCSQPCDQVCPDAPGNPVTFCVDDAVLPVGAPDLGDGACHTRCDFGYFPESGCRPEYGCQVVPRANEPETELYACLPGDAPPLPDCYLDLAERGIRFEPTVIPDRSPSTHPGLTCHVEDPIILRPPLHEVDVLTTNGDSQALKGSCEMGHSLSDTVLDVKSRGARAVFHLGTLNCRVIAGTDTLSQHGNGAAIDIWGFELDDGTIYSLVDDWEHDTPTPASPAGAWLYDAAYSWHDEGYWHNILTPNFNDVHDNHFHVDLEPGADFIRSSRRGYFGPAPYAD